MENTLIVPLVMKLSMSMILNIFTSIRLKNTILYKCLKLLKEMVSVLLLL